MQVHDCLLGNGAEGGVAVEPEAVFHGWRQAGGMSAGRNLIEWKSRRRDVPERLEPSLSDGALAEEEGLDRFVLYCVPLMTIIVI